MVKESGVKYEKAIQYMELYSSASLFSFISVNLQDV
jgi:hypothetical protein